MKIYKKIDEQWRFTKCANDELYCELYNDFAQVQLPKPILGNYTIEYYNENDVLITGIGSYQNVGYNNIIVSFFDFVNAGNPCFYAKFTNGTTTYYTDMYCWTGQERCRKIWTICDNTKPLVFDLISATGAQTNYIANISNDIKVVNYLGTQHLETSCDVISVSQKDVSQPLPFPVLCSSALVATETIPAAAICKSNYIEIKSDICQTANGYTPNIKYFTYKFLLGGYIFAPPQPNGESGADVSEYFTVGDVVINLVTGLSATVTFSSLGVINFSTTAPFDNSGNIVAGIFVNLTKEEKIIQNYVSTCLDNSCVKIPYTVSSFTLDRFWSYVFDAPTVGDGVWDFQSWLPIFPSYVIGDVFTVIDTQTNITYTLPCVDNWSAGGINAFPFQDVNFPSPPIPYYSYFKIFKNGYPVTFTYEYTSPNFNIYNAEQSLFSNKKIICANIREEEPNVEVKYNNYSCKAYKSSITKAYTLEINQIIPPYAMVELTNILMRGEVYINDIKMIYKGGKISKGLTKIKGRKIEIPLEDCTCEQTYYC